MFDAVLDCQTQLIAALDARDADAILSASSALAAAAELLRRHEGGVERQSLELGLRQAEAARIRIKYLTAWNRQKLDRLAGLRGQSSGNIYAKPGNSG
jgi:hypothetical protein